VLGTLLYTYRVKHIYRYMLGIHTPSLSSTATCPCACAHERTVRTRTYTRTDTDTQTPTKKPTHRHRPTDTETRITQHRHAKLDPDHPSLSRNSTHVLQHATRKVSTTHTHTHTHPSTLPPAPCLYVSVCHANEP